MRTLVSSYMLDALAGLLLWLTLTGFGYSAPFLCLIEENTVRVVDNLSIVILHYCIHESTYHQMYFCYSFKKNSTSYIQIQYSYWDLFNTK